MIQTLYLLNNPEKAGTFKSKKKKLCFLLFVMFNINEIFLSSRVCDLFSIQRKRFPFLGGEFSNSEKDSHPSFFLALIYLRVAEDADKYSAWSWFGHRDSQACFLWESQTRGTNQKQFECLIRWSRSLSARREWQTKSTGPKNLQIKVGTPRFPRLLVIEYFDLCSNTDFA